jgi:Protein of unknown function (DUF3887)
MHRIIIFLLVLAMALTSCARDIQPTIDLTSITPPVPSDNRQEIALNLIDELNQENFQAVYEQFDDTMKKEMPVDKIREAWRTVIRNAGLLEKTIKVRNQTESGYNFVIVTAAFSDGYLDVQVAFDLNDQIAGLHFTPAK